MTEFTLRYKCNGFEYRWDISNIENLPRDDITDIIRRLTDIREDLHKIRERLNDV